MRAERPQPVLRAFGALTREAVWSSAPPIIVAAALTVVRTRKFTHLSLVVPFIVLLTLAGFAPDAN